MDLFSTSCSPQDNQNPRSQQGAPTTQPSPSRTLAEVRAPRRTCAGSDSSAFMVVACARADGASAAPQKGSSDFESAAKASRDPVARWPGSAPDATARRIARSDWVADRAGPMGSPVQAGYFLKRSSLFAASATTELPASLSRAAVSACSAGQRQGQRGRHHKQVSRPLLGGAREARSSCTLAEHAGCVCLGYRSPYQRRRSYCGCPLPAPPPPLTPRGRPALPTALNRRGQPPPPAPLSTIFPPPPPLCAVFSGCWA